MQKSRYWAEGVKRAYSLVLLLAHTKLVAGAPRAQVLVNVERLTDATV